MSFQAPPPASSRQGGVQEVLEDGRTGTPCVASIRGGVRPRRQGMVNPSMVQRRFQTEDVCIGLRRGDVTVLFRCGVAGHQNQRAASALPGTP